MSNTLEALNLHFSQGHRLFKGVIFTLYQSPTSDAEVTRFLESHDLFAPTVPATRIRSNGFAQRLAFSDTPVYVHTLNDCAPVRELLALGVHGVYSDYLGTAACVGAPQ